MSAQELLNLLKAPEQLIEYDTQLHPRIHFESQY